MLFVVGSTGDICFNLKWVMITRGKDKGECHQASHSLSEARHRGRQQSGISPALLFVKKHIKHSQGHEGGIFIVKRFYIRTPQWLVKQTWKTSVTRCIIGL
ncbi:hypothetical protein ACFX13_043739 [Malus domestica]